MLSQWQYDLSLTQKICVSKISDRDQTVQPLETIRGLKVSFGSEELAQTKDLGDSVRIPTYKEEFSSRNKLFFG